MSDAKQAIDHSGRFRLAIVMPNGYGMDVSWEDRKTLEEVLRLVVECMDKDGGIDNAVHTIVGKFASAERPDCGLQLLRS